MRKIENYEEWKGIYTLNHDYHYYGNRPITEEKKRELEEKDYKKSFNRYDIYLLDDNNYMMFDTKPTIHSRLYYDDETPEPGKTLQYFINYNMMNFHYDMSDYKKEIESLKNCGCCSGRVELKPFINYSFYSDEIRKSKEVYAVFYQCCGNSKRDKTTVRDLTDEEIKQYFEICENLKNEYIERLTKYFNKYNKNINTCGYWANR